MSAVNWDQFPWEEAMPGFQRKVVHGEGISLALAKLAPDAVVPEHAHPHEQFTTVMQGVGVFLVDGRELPVKEGDVLHFPSEMPHGRTAGGQGMRLLDIFSPIREDFPASTPK